MKYLIALLIAFAITSCSVQRQLNRKVDRVERFARKHNLTMKDTLHVTIQDTVIIEEHHRDTLTSFVRDTITTVIDDDKVRVEYIYDTKTNTIHHYATVKGDTIIKTITVDVPVDRIIYKETFNWNWLWFLIIPLIIWIGYKIVKKFFL